MLSFLSFNIAQPRGLMRFLPYSVSHILLVYLTVFRPALVIFAKQSLSITEASNYDHYIFLSRGHEIKPEYFARIFQSLTINQGFSVSAYRDAFSFLVKYDSLLHLEPVIDMFLI